MIQGLIFDVDSLLHPNDCHPPESTPTPDDVPAGVRTCLRLLRARGLRLAAGSCRRDARSLLARTELLGAFDAVADGTMIIHALPEPDVFFCAADRLRLGTGQCAVVENSPVGLSTARRAGMRTIALGEVLDEGVQADHMLRTTEDLLHLPIYGYR